MNARRVTPAEPTVCDPDLIRARLLSAAAGTSPVAVFAVDAVGVVVFAEGGGTRALTGGLAELEGLSLLDAWGETPALVTAIAGALSGSRFAGDVVAGTRRFEVRVVPLQDAKDRICGAAGIAVEADPALHDGSESREAPIIEALVETLPLSIWILDQSGEVVHDNALAREYGRAAVRAARDEKADGASLVGRVLEQGREGRGVVRVKAWNGSPVDVPVRGVPLRGEDGGTVGAVLLAAPPRPEPAPPSLIDSIALSLPPAVSVVEAWPLA